VLQAHGIYATTPSWVLAQPDLPGVCRDVAMQAHGHYAAAVKAIAACPRHNMRPAAVMLGIYRELLNKLIARGWTRLDEPARISAWRKLALVVRHGLAGR
jgi:phytoene synthase